MSTGRPRPPMVRRQSHFGPYLDLSGWLPLRGASSLVVATRRHQLNPVAVRLPHQLYTEWLAKLMHDGGASSVWVQPVLAPWLCIAGNEAGQTHPRNIDTTGGRHGK